MQTEADVSFACQLSAFLFQFVLEPLPKNYNVQILQSLSWLSRLNWLCQWVGVVCVNRHRSRCLLVPRCFSEQRRRSWENCLEDEWFCCIWFVNVITIFWWESTCRFFFKTQPSKMICFRFKEKRRVKAEAGWFHNLTVLAFYPWWIPVMR